MTLFALGVLLGTSCLLEKYFSHCINKIEVQVFELGSLGLAT